MTTTGPGGLPQVVPLPGLPPRVTIYEVAPRDGLQNEDAIVGVEIKAEFIRRLVDCGLRTVEITSFVHPKWVPQLADAEQLVDLVAPSGGSSGDRYGAVRMPVLVPNQRGLDRALDKGIRDIAIFTSATETFAQRNLNRSYDEQFAMFEPVVGQARAAGLSVRGYLSMCFGDPWEGPVPIAQVVEACRRLVDLGCTELSLGDTIGVGTPGHVEALVGALAEAGVEPGSLGGHFHDTYGQALANGHAALRCGVPTLDSSAGGLGGCPYAESATGNLATEDLVWQLQGMGVETGVDLDALVQTSVWMARQLGKRPVSRVVTALAGAALDEVFG